MPRYRRTASAAPCTLPEYCGERVLLAGFETGEIPGHAGLDGAVGWERIEDVPAVAVAPPAATASEET